MVDVAVAATALVAGTASADIASTATGTAMTTGQTFSLATGDRTLRRIIVIKESGSANLTIVFDAGVNPPSLRQGLGTLTVTLTSLQAKMLVLDGGRYINATGLITGTVTGTCRLWIFTEPKTN